MRGTKKAVRGSGRVSFLARLDSTKKRIEEGHPLLSIYQEHEKDFGFSYSQFVKYVHKFIRSKPDESQGTKPAAQSIRTIRTRRPGEPAFVSSDTPRDKDSLIGGKK